jgi:RNA polymerase sigma factor (sigma-70 family)
MIDDATLLERYARDRSEEAFAELVRRHLTLVYSAALRRTDGDAHRAHDVAQIVFTRLAKDAATLNRHPALVGWLYAATRSAAIDLMRTERRRRQREEKAHIMEEISSSHETPADWEQLRPVLDDVMDELDERDREAVLLRFFKGQPFATVASALRLSEDAARKRVGRALEKLGGLLERRGITSTSGALAVLLANQVAVATPASVAAEITAAAIAGAGPTAGASAVGTAGIFIMSTSKIGTAITTVVALIAIGSAIYQAQASREAAATAASVMKERDALRARLAAIEKRVLQSDAKLAVQKQASEATQPSVAAAPRQVASGNPALDYVLEHPETHAAFVEQFMLSWKAHYDGFFKKAGLSAEQQERVLNLMKEVRTGELDLLAALHTQGYDRGDNEDPRAMSKEVMGTVKKIGMEDIQQREAAMRAILGDDGFTAYQQYSATISQRNVADQVAAQLYNTNEPLTAQQAEQLVEVLTQNAFNPRAESAPGNTINGTVVSQSVYSGRLIQVGQQGGMSVLDWQAPVTDAAIARAQSILTPAQFAALKQMQANQAVLFQLAPPPPPTAIPSLGIMLSHR